MDPAAGIFMPPDPSSSGMHHLRGRSSTPPPAQQADLGAGVAAMFEAGPPPGAQAGPPRKRARAAARGGGAAKRRGSFGQRSCKWLWKRLGRYITVLFILFLASKQAAGLLGGLGGISQAVADVSLAAGAIAS